MGAHEAVVVGVDYGTLSGRAVVVRVSDGEELGSAVHPYAHAVMEAQLTAGPAAAAGHGAALPPDWALQVPDDYRDVLRTAVPAALAAARDAHGVSPDDVIGIATDFTACTMVPTTPDGTPLCELPAFADRPHAYVKLWKHHAAQPQADRINALAHERQEPWINRYGGLISSEWEFAKGLQLLEEDPEIYSTMRHWVEAADWIVWQLCGSYVRNACTAGYKGILQDGAYPSHDFLTALNPDFTGFVREKLEHPIGQLGQAAGRLTAEAAGWTGLPEGIAVAVGNVDAHVTAPAAGAVEPGQMTAIMGTSTCHVMNGDVLAEVPGMCGVVDGGIVEGLWGYEAGQSGVGDIFGWFVEHGVPASYAESAAARGISVHELLTELAAGQEIGEHGLIALDWHSGNRSVLVDHELSGVVVGQTLATRAEDTYRALLEATAFGTRTIVETFTAAGVPVTELVVAGGLLKNALLMQIYADVTRLPLSTITSEQGPALGSAIHAAVAAGAYPDVRAAAAAMGRRVEAAYRPIEANAVRYDALFAEYTALHDYFGRGTNDVMHRLKAIRRQAHADRLATGSATGAPAAAGVSAAAETAAAASSTAASSDTGVTTASSGTSALLAAPPSHWSAELLAAVEQTRAVVSRLHAELPRWELIVWTAGNVSQRVRGAAADGSDDLLVIKPSGVTYDELTPESMVVCDLDGRLVWGTRSPSSDTAAHAYVYRNMPEVGGVVHTHSTYATAWAARAEPVPCVLTMMADEFGGDVPIGPFALIGDDSIGRGIVETLRSSRSPAVLMQNHGPFTIGKDAKAAVKAAAMVEEVARTVHISRQLGDPLPISPDKVDALYDRYQHVYGQSSAAPAASPTSTKETRS